MHQQLLALLYSNQGWPTQEQWDWLHKVNTLDEQALPDVVPMSSIAHFTFNLPMPGVVLLCLRPI
jgi:hypothetical protein